MLDRIDEIVKMHKFGFNYWKTDGLTISSGGVGYNCLLPAQPKIGPSVNVLLDPARRYRLRLPFAQ
jgi:hypothetical protein